jgi:hypothetical protein
MAGPAPKTYLPVPDNYWDLPESERLAVAEQLAAALQEGLPDKAG